MLREKERKWETMRDKGFSENVVGLEFVVNGEKELSKKWQRDKVERLQTIVNEGQM